jgi:hypothetical protein
MLARLIVSSIAIRDCHVADVSVMAELAEAKRQHYRDHASPFQRPARGGREIHESFLRELLEREDFTVLVHDAGGSIDGFIVARFGSAPPPFGEGSLFHVDDFVLADPTTWLTVGRALLDEVMRRAEGAGIEKVIVVSGPASVDEAKTAFLRAVGLVVEAQWRVKPLVPTTGHVPEKQGFDAAIGPAPSVYDPGGLTALALRIDSTSAVQRFEEFAAASNAVVAIVPLLTSDDELRAELDRRSYVVASEWDAHLRVLKARTLRLVESVCARLPARGAVKLTPSTRGGASGEEVRRAFCSFEKGSSAAMSPAACASSASDRSVNIGSSRHLSGTVGSTA